jgi:energy-coupling factor transport system substrate-specific component
VRATAARAGLGRELAYLASAQDANGGFGAAPGQASSELYTAWAAIGLAAAGRDPATTRRDGHSVLNAIGAEASTLEGPGDLERTILALRACGAPTGSLAGKNLLGGLLHYRASDGSFGHLLNITAFAIFALRASGRAASDPVVSAAARWIAHHQDADGGYDFAGSGGASDVDDTAAALQGLVDGGLRSGSSVTRAVVFIEHAQNPDGGFPAQPHQESNAQSTAWAIQGLHAAGHDVEAVRNRGSRSPLGYLESLVAPNGSVRYSRTSAQTPVWVTAQALAALALKPFPVGPAG